MTTSPGTDEPRPVDTDNSPRPEDGPQDLPQDPTPFSGDADTEYDPDLDGIQ